MDCYQLFAVGHPFCPDQSGQISLVHNQHVLSHSQNSYVWAYSWKHLLAIAGSYVWSTFRHRLFWQIPVPRIRNWIHSKLDVHDDYDCTIVLLTTIIYCIQYCVYYITKQYDIFPQVKKKMKAKLVERHGFYLRLLIESSMELIICFLVEMFMKQTSTNFEMLSYFTSVAMIAIYVQFVKMIFEVLDWM